MRRIYFLVFLVLQAYSVLAGSRVSRDSIRKKIDTLSGSKFISKESLLRKKILFISLPGDTSKPSPLNSLPDTLLVLSRDFPMPVGENSFFDNELYKQRLDSLQKMVPLTYNQSVQSYINLYVYKRRPFIERLLGEGKYYFPIFEKAMLEAGLPGELKYLPVIESALNPFAVSRVGATGPWQIMYGTGKDYGLQINSSLDERRDPYRSSQAAARYFKDMFQRYGDWLLVIASYNCGKGNVDKAIRRAKGPRDFWSIQRFLPRETRTYVPAFIAATYIMNYAGLHGLHIPNASFFPHPDTLQINQKVSLISLANNLCVSKDEIRLLNPQFRKNWVEGKEEAPVNILVPGGNSERIPEILNFLKSNPDQFDSSNLNDDPDKSGKSMVSRMVHHKVRRGETLMDLAHHYSCKVEEIQALNHLHSRKLVSGQRLRIKEIVSINESYNVPSAGRITHYKVRKGDTLQSIAMQFNITIRQIKGLNRLHSNLVRKGQNLKLSNRI